MWKEILTYNSSVLILNVEIKQHVDVHLSNFIYEQVSNSFVLITQKKQTIQSLKIPSGKNKISSLGFKVILDHHCEIFLPYFIAQDGKECYLFCLDLNNVWSIRYNFTIPKVLGKHIQIGDGSYSIENGPTLIWTFRDEIFIYKAEYSLGFKGPVNDILRLPIDSNCNNGLEVAGSISWWKCGDNEQGIIITKDNQEAVNSYLITIDNVKKKANIASNRKIIPFPYLAITTCSLVIPEYMYLASNKDPNGSSCRVYITTTQSQLLEFHHGKYIKHINIPFSSCQNIQIFENPKDELILLCSEEDQVCAVDWLNSKIVKTYQVFSKVLLDDFMGLGTFQTLLLHSLQHEGNESFDNFILTDFCKVCVEISKSNKKENIMSRSGCTDVEGEIVEGSINNVVNALMKKVQATEVFITECKKEKSEKRSFVRSHCKNLCNMLMNEITSPAVLQISSVAQLVVGQEASRKELLVHHPKMIVRSKWQEITNSKWIIGIDIENSGQRAVSDVSLCIVSQTSGYFISSSKVLPSEIQIKNQGKQALSSGEKTTLVAITLLPNFSFENHVTVSLMLTWKHGKDEYQSQFCGNMTLLIEDVIKGSKRNCLHAAFSSLKTQIMISLANCDIRNVTEVLKSKMDTCQQSSSCDKYHLKYPFATTLVSWTSNKSALVMNIFTRDYNELCMCLRLLQQQLPDILTWSLSGTNLALELVMTTIENEICFILEEVNTLLKAPTITVRTSEIEVIAVEESEEIPVKRRKVFQHKRGVDNQTVDPTICWKFFSDICSYACNTDDVFLTILFHQHKPE